MYKILPGYFVSARGYLPELHPLERLVLSCLGAGINNKWVMRIKLTTVLLMMGILQVSATSFAQKITLRKTNASIISIFDEIGRQSGYGFFYDAKSLKTARPVSINLEKAELKEAMDRCLQGQGLTYDIEGKVIVVRPLNPASVSPDAEDSFDLKGVIFDETGKPLPGVTIKVKGSGLCTISDAGGNFLLPRVNEKNTIQFIYVGYKTREFPASPKTMTIKMEPDISELAQVNVNYSSGYNVISSSRATGAYEIITKDQLDKPTTNIASRLVGITAGVVSKLDADGNPTFEIRGQTSLNANSQPLVVVDGFAVEGSFNNINPNDVASVSILKDAAAAAIWGARAANGVIVITTKTSKKDKALSIELGSFVRWGAKPDQAYVNPLAGSAETIEFEKLAFNKWGAIRNTGLLPDYGKVYSQGFMALNEADRGHMTITQRDAILEQLAGGNNKQQIADYLLAAPVNQQYNLSVSGSTARSSNIFSLMFSDNQSNFKKTGSQQYLMNYRNTSKVFSWLDFSFSGMFQYNKNRNDGVSLGYITGLSPYDMLVGPDGNYLNVINTYYWPILERSVPMGKFPYSDWTFNPIKEMNSHQLGSKDLNARFQAGLTFKVIKGLTYDSKIQYELFNTFNRSLYNEESFYVRDRVNTSSTWNKTTQVITPNLPTGSILDQSRTEVRGYSFRNQLNLNKNFGEHGISFTAGSELNSRVLQSFFNPTTYGYNDEKLTVGTFPRGAGGTFFQIQNWMGANQTFAYTNRFTYATDRYFSLYGNAAYTFRGKYTLSGSVRTDASNLITDDPAYRYAPFWSTGFRWQLSDEPFLEQVKWIDWLALRVTYGVSGNVDKSTAVKPLISMGSTPDVFTQEYQANLVSFGNPTLRWEHVATTNIGVDFSLLQGKLSGKLSAYRKNSTDLIASISIPRINGTGDQRFNNASMLNQGIEVEVGTSLDILGNKLRWRGGLSFAYNRNRVTDLYKQSYTASDLSNVAYVEGKNSQTLWAYKYAGLYNLGTASTPNWQPMVQGPDADTRYAFANGWPIGNATTYMLDMGTTVAPYVMGFTSQFKIYDFDLSFIVTGKFGHKFRSHSFNYPQVSNKKLLPNARLSEVLNADPSKMLPLPLNPNEPAYSSWSLLYPYLDYLTSNAGHLRMQEVSLSYTVPSKLLTKSGIGQLQFYGQANNLFVITSNKYDEDPEFPLGTLRSQPKFTFGFKLSI